MSDILVSVMDLSTTKTLIFHDYYILGVPTQALKKKPCYKIGSLNLKNLFHYIFSRGTGTPNF